MTLSTAYDREAEDRDLPSRRRPVETRWVVAAVAAAVAFVAATGGLTGVVFHQVSTTKWLVVTLVPAGVAALALTERRITYLAGLCVCVIPFSTFVVSGPGIAVEIQWAVLTPAVGVAFLVPNARRTPGASGATAFRQPALGLGVIVAALALVPAVLSGGATSAFITQFVAVAALAYVVLRACALDRGAPSLLALVIVGIATFEALLAIDQFRTGRAFSAYGGGVAAYGPKYFFGYQGVFRPTGSYSDPNSLGNVLAIGLPFAFAGAAMDSNFYRRMAFGVGGIVISGGLILSLSRMSWVAGIVGVVLALVLSPRRLWARQAVGVVVAAFVLFATVVALAGNQLVERFRSVFDPTAQGVPTADGDLTRERLWSAALDTFGHHPLFGIGFGNLDPTLLRRVAGTNIFSHAHSTYFQYLAEAGALGGVAILALLIAVARDLRFVLRTRETSRWVTMASAGAVVGMLVCWSTDYTIHYTSVLLWMALPFCLAAGTAAQKAKHPAGVR